MRTSGTSGETLALGDQYSALSSDFSSAEESAVTDLSMLTNPSGGPITEVYVFLYARNEEQQVADPSIAGT